MNSTITKPNVQKMLAELYVDANTNDPVIRQNLKRLESGEQTKLEHFQARKSLYMPVDLEFGNMLYALTRGARAKTIVEFGTSFGISTLFLAAAIQDNGGGKIITTEFISEKAQKAHQNLAAVGLADSVEFRIGDALKTLDTNLPKEIDLVFLDGAKDLYLGILKLLEPCLKSGSLIVSDNTDHEGIESFLEYIRAPKNGYFSAAIQTPDQKLSRAHELTVRL